MDPDEEAAQLKLLVDQLKGLIRTKDEEVQVKNSALKDTESKVSKLKLQLKGKEAKVSSLTKQLHEKQRKTSDGGQTTQDVAENGGFPKLLDEKENMIRQQLKVIKDHDKKYTALQKQYEEKCIEEEKGLKDNRRLEELTQALVNKDQLIGAFSSQIEELEKSFKQKQDENEVLKTKLFESETLSHQQKVLLDKLSITVEKQEEKVAIVNEERSTGFSHMQEDMEKMAEEVVSLTTKLQDKEGTVSILEDHILQLKKEHEAQTADVMETSQEQEDLLRTLKRRMHEQEEVMTGKEKVLQLLQDEAEDRIQEHQELQKTISILQQNLRETVESKELLQEALRSQERSTSPVFEHQQQTTSSVLEEKEKLLAEKDNIIAQLSATLQQYENAYKLATEQNSALREENLTAKEKIQSLQESAEKWQLLAEDSSKVFAQKEEDYRLTVDSFEENVKNLMEELTHAKIMHDDRMEDSEKRMKTVLTELDSQTLVLEKQTQDLHLSQNENTELKSQLGTLSADLHGKKEEDIESIEDLRKRMKLKDEEVADGTLKVENLSKELEELHSKVEKQEEKNNILLKEKEQLMHERESLITSQTMLQEEVKYATIENGKLQIRVEDLEEENENLQTKIQTEESQHEGQSSSWGQERQNLLQELQEEESRFRDEYSSQISKFESKIQKFTRNLEEVSREKHQQEKQLQEHDQWRTVTEGELESLTKENNDLKIKIAETESQIEENHKMMEDFRDEVETLKQENGALCQKKEDLESLSCKYEEEMIKLTTGFEESSQRNLTLERELVCLTESLDVQKKENEVISAFWSEKCQNVELQLEETSRYHKEESQRLQDSVNRLEEGRDSLIKNHEALKQEREEGVKILNEEYNVTVKGLEENLTSLNNELEESKINQRETASKFSESDERIKILSDEKVRHDNRIQELDTVISELESKCESALVDKANLESQLCAAKSSGEDAQKRIEELSILQDQLKDASLRIKYLESDVENANQESSDMEKLRSKALEEIQELKKDLEEELTKSHQFEEEACNLKNLLQEKEGTCDQLENDLQETKNLNQTLSGNLTSLESRLQGFSDLHIEEVSNLKSSFELLKRENETLTTEHETVKAHLEQKIIDLDGEKSSLSSELKSTSEELENVKSSLNDREADVMKKIELLEQMSTQYASLRSELEASHTEYKRLMAEMAKPSLSGEEITAEVQQEELVQLFVRKFSQFTSATQQGGDRVASEEDNFSQAISAFFEHQAKIESRLHETEARLQTVENEKDNAVHEATLLRRLKREHSQDFDDGDRMQFVGEPSGHAHKGGLEYLQSQLEELANEQEQQAVDHQRVTTVLNDKIDRITAEKDQLLEAYHKQSSELEEIFESFNEKTSECQQLDAVITEQQRDLTKVRGDLNKVTKSSEYQQKTLHELENKFLQLQEKFNTTAADLECSKNIGQDLEFELKESKSLLKTTQDQALSSNDQVEKHSITIVNLQQDLDQAMEQVDALNTHYNEDTTKLKSLLREKDQEISLLHDDVAEKNQEVTTLTQSLKERNAECVNFNDLLTAQTEKVGQLESVIRQHETELALISELQGEREQVAVKAKEMAEYISKLEQSSKTSEENSKDLMQKIDVLQSQLIEREGALERLSRESSRIQESHLKKEEEKENRLTNTEDQLLALRQQLAQSQQAMASLSAIVEKNNEESSQLEERCSQRESQLFIVQEELANMQQLLQDKDASFRQQMLIEAEKFEKVKKDEVRELAQHLEKQIQETDSHHKSKVEALQVEITSLHEQATELSREKENAQSELFNSREETEQLREKVETLEKWEMEAQEKSKLCEDLQSTCSLLEERLQESSGKLRAYEQQNTVLQKNFSEASEKATEKENLVIQLDEALSASNSEVRRLKDALSEESERQVKEIDGVMNANLEGRDNHIKYLESENARIQELSTASEKEVEELKNTCTELETEFESARKEYELKLDGEAKRHAEDLGVLNSLLEENRMRLQEITEARKQDDLKEEAWAKPCTELEAELHQIRDELETSRMNLSSVSEKEHELSAEISSLNEQLNESKVKEEEFKEASAKHDVQIEKVKKIIRGLQIQLKQGKEKIARLEKEKEEMKDAPQQIDTETKQSHDRDLEEMREKIADMEKEVSLHKSNSEESTMLTASLKEQLLTTIQAFDTFKQDTSINETQLGQSISELQELLNTKTESLKASQERIELLNEEVSSLTQEINNWKNEAGDLAVRLEDAESGLRSVEEALSSAEKRNLDLMSFMEDKDEELNVVKTQSHSFKESITVLALEKSQLETVLHEKDVLLQNLSSSSTDDSEKLTLLQEAIAAKDSEMQNVVFDAERYKNMFESVSSELEKVKEDSATLESSLRENSQSLTQMFSQKEEENVFLGSENEKLKASLLKNTEELQRLSENSQSVTQMFSQKEEENVFLCSENEKLKASLLKNTEELQRLSAKLENVESELHKGEEVDSELVTLKSKIEAIEQELATKVSELHEVSLKCSGLEKELAEKVQEVETAKEQNENLKEVISNRENEVCKISAEFEEVQNEIQQLRESFDNKDEELESVKLKLDQRKEISENDSTELESVRESFQNRVEEHNQKVEEMSSTLAVKQEENDLLVRKLTDCEQKILEFQNLLQEKDNDVAKKNDRIRTFELEMNSVKENLYFTQNQLEDVMRQNGDLRSSSSENDSLHSSLNQELEITMKRKNELEDGCMNLETQLEEKSNMVSDLQSHLKEKEEALKMLEELHRTSSSRITELEMRIQEGSNDSSTIDELQRMNGILRNSLNERDEELGASGSRMTQLQEEVENLQQEKVILEKNQEELMQRSAKVEPNTVQTSSAAFVNDSDGIQKTTQDVSKEQDDLRTKVSELESHLEEKSKSLFETQRKLKASLVSRKNVMEKLKVAENKLKSLEEHPEPANETNESLNQSFDSTSSSSPRSTNDDLAEQLSAMKSKNAELFEQIGMKEKERDEFILKEDELKKMILDLRGERDYVFGSLQEKEDKIQALYQQLQNIQVKTEDSQHMENEIIATRLSHQEEVKNLLSQMEDIRADSRKNQDRSVTLQEELDTLVSSYESLKEDYQKKNAECADLQEDTSVLLDEKSKLEDELESKKKELEDKLENLQSILQIKEDSLVKLRSELDEVKNQDPGEKQDESELENLRDLLNDKEERLSETNIRISDLEHDLMKVNEESKELKEEGTHLREALEKEKAHHMKKHEELIHLKENYVRRTQEAEDLRRDLEDLQSKAENERISLNNRLLEETENLKSRLSSVQEEKDLLDSEVNILRSEKEHKSARIETERITLLQKTKDDAIKDKDQLQRKLKAALVSRKELIVQEKQLKEEVEILKSYKEKYKESHKQLEELKTQEKENGEEFSEMRSRREKDIRILKESKRKISDLEKKNQEETRVIQEHQNKIHDLELELARMDESMKTRESDVSTLESCNNDLNEIVTALEAKKKSLQKKLEEDVEVIRNLQKEIKSLREEGSSGISPEGFEDIKDRLEAAEWDKETLEEKMKHLEEEKKEKVSMLDKVLDDFKKESIAKQELMTRCGELQEELGKVRIELDERVSEEVPRGSQDEASVQSLKQKNESLLNSLLNANSDLKRVIHERDSLEEELQVMKVSQSDSHQDELSTLKEENDELKSSLASANDQLEEQKKDDDSSTSGISFSASSLRDDLMEDSHALEQDILLAKRTILEETLGQLKVTQPENWDQEPGVKKLIDKLEYLADKAAVALRDSKASSLKCKQAEAAYSKMKIQWDSLQDSLQMNEKTIHQQAEMINTLNKRISDVKIESPDTAESLRIELLQLSGEHNHLQSSSNVQLQSFEQIHHENKEEIEKLKNIIQEMENDQSELKEELHVKVEEIKVLDQQIQNLESEKKGHQEEVIKLREELETKEKQVTELEKQRDNGLSELEFYQKNPPDRMFTEDGKLTSSVHEEEEIRSSSARSFSSLAESYTRLIRNVNAGNLDAEEMQTQHQALVQELISKEEELASVKEEFDHLSLAYDEMIQKAELPHSQALDAHSQALEKRVEASDAESSASIEQENLLRSEVDETKRKMTNMSKELKRREKLVSELVSDCKRLKTELEREKDASASLRSESEGLRTQAKSLACLKTQYEANENHLKSELAVKDRLLQRQKDELDYSRTEQERLRKEFGAGSPREVQAILAAYLEDINKLKGGAMLQSAELDDKMRRISQLEQEVETKNTEIENLSSKVESLTEKRVSATEIIQNLQDELSALGQEKDVLLQELDPLRDARDSLKERDSTIEMLMSEKSKMQEEDKVKSSMLSQLQMDAENLSSEVESLNLRVREEQAANANLNDEKNRALSDLDDKTSFLQAIQEENVDNRSRLEELNTQLNERDSSLKTLQDQKKIQEENLEESKSELEQLREKNENLTLDAKRLKMELETTSSNFSSFVETTKERQRKLDVAERSLRSLTGDLASVDDKHSTTSLILEDVRSKMGSPKIATEVLVRSESVEAGVKSLSRKSLKDKNPLVRLQRKLESYEEALSWMNESKKKVETQNLELQNLYGKLKINYDGNISQLEEVQSSLLKMQKKLEESEIANKRITKDADFRCANLENEMKKKDSFLEEMRAGLLNTEKILNEERERVNFLEDEIEKFKDHNHALATNLKTARDHIHKLESSPGAHMQHLQAVEQKLLSQNSQLEHLLAERQQLGGQLNALHNNLQEYQSRYANLHNEYVKISEEHSKCQKTTGNHSPIKKTVTDIGAPGGPPVKNAPESPEHKHLQRSLHDANIAKRQLAEKLSQIEDQLRDEIERRSEVEELLQNLRKCRSDAMKDVSLYMSPVVSDEEVPILLKPESITRKIQSASSSCSRWLRGRSLRWANPSKSRMCPHFRPLSFQTLALLYLIGLHILLLKCFLV